MSTYLAAIHIKEVRNEVVLLAHDYFTRRYFIYSTAQVILICDRTAITYLGRRHKSAIRPLAFAKICLACCPEHVGRSLFAPETKDFLYDMAWHTDNTKNT